MAVARSVGMILIICAVYNFEPTSSTEIVNKITGFVKGEVEYVRDKFKNVVQTVHNFFHHSHKNQVETESAPVRPNYPTRPESSYTPNGSAPSYSSKPEGPSYPGPSYAAGEKPSYSVGSTGVESSNNNGFPDSNYLDTGAVETEAPLPKSANREPSYSSKPVEPSYSASSTGPESSNNNGSPDTNYRDTGAVETDVPLPKSANPTPNQSDYEIDARNNDIVITNGTQPEKNATES